MAAFPRKTKPFAAVGAPAGMPPCAEVSGVLHCTTPVWASNASRVGGPYTGYATTKSRPASYAALEAPDMLTGPHTVAPVTLSRASTFEVPLDRPTVT